MMNTLSKISSEVFNELAQTEINIDYLRDVLPRHIDADEMKRILQQPLTNFFLKKIQQPRDGSFWFEFNFQEDKLFIRESNDKKDIRHSFVFLIGMNKENGEISDLAFPLNSVLNANIIKSGNHSVYAHTILTDVPLKYIGVTKQRWLSRYNQHLSSARTGSQLVFHKALREHKDKKIENILVFANLSFEQAMNIEERMVNNTLYPKGLNMIPGGFAGIRYLHKLGFAVRSIKARDSVIEKICKMPSIRGIPNPLCSARWLVDQDFVNRVICGHGDRLTVEQVRQIRLLNSFNISDDQIVGTVGAKNIRQVNNAVKGKHYSRVV